MESSRSKTSGIAGVVVTLGTTLVSSLIPDLLPDNIKIIGVISGIALIVFGCWGYFRSFCYWMRMKRMGTALLFTASVIFIFAGSYMAFCGVKALGSPKTRPSAPPKSTSTPKQLGSNENKPADADKNVVVAYNSSVTPEVKVDSKIVIQCESTIILPSDQPQKINVLQLLDNDTGGNQFSGTNMIIASKEPLFKCEIVNYSSETMLEVRVPVMLYFKEAKRSEIDNSLESGKPSRYIEKYILVTKIDTGEDKKYTIYMQNASNRFVDFRFGHPARVKFLSTEKEIESKVVWPYLEMQKHGMFLPPSELGGKYNI